MQIDGKTLVITGGGNGIGQQVALEAVRRGATVAAVDIRQDGLDTTAALARPRDRMATYTVDITDREAVHALPDRVEADLGSIDGLVNVAGIIQPFLRLNELDYDAIERVIDVNLWGTIHVLKAFLPGLLERPEAHIATVSSMGGFLPVPGQTVYGATKAAVKLMTEGLYSELIERNVGVSVVMPGAVSTEITQNSGIELPVDDEAASQIADGYRMTSPERAAEIILDGIEREKLHIHVGRDASLLHLAARVGPKRATHLIYSQMSDLLG